MELRIPKEGEERYAWERLDTIQEMLRRAEVLRAADKDPELRAGLREMCRRDPVFFCDNFCWIYEPRPGLEHIQPWHIYPHEIRQIDWMERRFAAREDGLIEKSREMGASWTFCLWAAWHFLFDDEFSCLIGSRVEDLVDNKLPDSIFGKLEFILKYIPSWLRPANFDFGKHRLFMKITNPNNHNALTGESTNPQFSRSGRYSAIILDEFAYVERSYSIWQAAADSSPVRFPISTPHGKGNKFGELAHDPNVKKLTLHWRLHPEKDQAWYDNEKKRRTEQEIAEELDISYERSQRGRVYQREWDELETQGRLTDCPYDPLYPVYTSWDFGIGDSTAITFYQVNRIGAVKLIDAYENSGYSIDHYIKVVQEKSYRYYQHYGDITIKRAELGTGRSVWEILKQNGIFIRGKVLRNKEDAINAVKMLLRTLYVDKKLVPFVDAMENYHYDWDEEHQIFHDTPVHDWSSHYSDSISYFALNWKPFEDRKPQKPRDTTKFRNSATTY